MVVYNEITPHPTLANYIDRYWFSENIGTTSCKSMILPDCCMDIILNFSNNTIIICGVMTSAQTITINAGQKMFGIRFLPGILPALLNTPAIQFTDSIISLAEIDQELAMALLGIFSIDPQQESYTTFCGAILESRLHAIDRNIALALNTLPTDYSVQALSHYLKTSVRQTQRIFAKQIGITPKRFLQIKRFMALQEGLSHNDASLACLSAANGYFDHAHMRKEYQILTNTYPKY